MVAPDIIVQFYESEIYNSKIIYIFAVEKQFLHYFI